MSGRARGRGLARGRGVPPSAAGGDPARRPGSAAPSAPPVKVPAQSGASGEPSGASNVGAGRASQRGGARGDQRPGPGVADLPITQMAEMSLGTGDSADRSRRREISYAEPDTRPAHAVDKKGSSGTPIALTTNYFSIDSSPGWQMYHYHCDFNPPIDSRKLRKGLIGDHADKLFKSYLFDGMQLFTSAKLPDEVTEVFSTRKYDDAKIRITIKRVAEMPPNSPNCIHIFNVMMRQILSDMGMKEVQRAYFSPNNAVSLKAHNLEIWPGFRTSILQYEEAVLLNVDVSHKVLRTDTVLDTMYAAYEKLGGGGGDLNRFKEVVQKALLGHIVLTRYNNKTYRVDDIKWNVHPIMKFEKKGQDITYMEYYKEAYGITIHDTNQPMLVSKPKKKDQREGAPELLYLVPELCTRTGLTDEMRQNFTLMKDMAVHTRVNPSKRVQTMHTFRQEMDKIPEVQKRMSGWGVRYSRDLVTLTGRTLDREKILLGPEGNSNVVKTVRANQDADWGRDIRGKLYTTVTLNNWLVVYCRNNEAVLNDFFDSLKRVSPPMGITFRAPTKVAVQNMSTSAFLDGIKSNVDHTVQLVLVILPSNKKDLYDAIKKQCCVETPVPSQCVTANVLKKPRGLMSVVSKIAIQINCKLGGEAWAVEIPLKKTMIIGIDTYHDSAKKGRSVAGFVASLNSTFTRYFSQTFFQSSNQELHDCLKVAVITALRKFHTINNFLPERIIVYRDGVGDGQLPVVVDHEVSQILAGAVDQDTNHRPMVTVIVVKKRINSKFFVQSGQGLANPPPGTVIDNTVTRRESYDFFVVSQSVNQGTVTPTHYNVIWDESNLKPDHLQKLTYKLCHLYYNWPGTIRVPAPCQYAHKLAFLTGQSIHKDADLTLADKLFYL